MIDGGRPSGTTRRRLIGVSAAAAVAGFSFAASRNDWVAGGGSMSARSSTPPSNAVGRLAARPGTPSRVVRPGVQRLGLDADRDALMVVPAGYRPDRPAPLVLSLHGAGGDEERGLYPLRVLADASGVILLSPASRGRTWDVILGAYGPDVAFVDRALAAAFARCAVDPARLAVAGFSDGASYALSLAIANGDLFPRVLAFSPGFEAASVAVGRPRFFVSHGTDDRVLPIDRTSRQIVPRLRGAGYDVRFREFVGGHTVPPEIAAEAVAWYLGEEGTPSAG